MADSETPQPMFVSVRLTITIKDAAQWTLAFGVEGSSAVRKDVKEYVLNEIGHAGVFGNGEVDAEITLIR